jgi:Sulfotransferase family
MHLLTSRLAPLSNAHAPIMGPTGPMISKQFEGFVRSVNAHFTSPSQVWAPGPDRQVWWTCILGDNPPRGTNATAPVAELAAANGMKVLSLAESEVEFDRIAFHRPLIIVAAPRSGSTLLFEVLARCGDFWSIGDESIVTIDGIPKLAAQHRGFDSNALGAEDADADTKRTLLRRFVGLLRNADNEWYPELPVGKRPSRIRFLEKTPRNAFRIPFLRAVFPDARFLYLYRTPEENIGSIMDVWQARSAISYPNLPDWDGPSWSLLLPPGWRSLRGQSVEHIAAYQWGMTNKCIIDSLSALPADAWCAVRYDDLLSQPAAVLRRLCDFAEVAWDGRLADMCTNGLPLSGSVLTPPKPGKWKKHAALIDGALQGIQPLAREIEAFVQAAAGVR